MCCCRHMSTSFNTGQDVMKIVLDAGMQIAKRREFRVQTANKKKKKTSSATADRDGKVDHEDEQEEDIANDSNDEDENAQVAASMIALSGADRDTNAPIHAQDGEVLDETTRESESIVCATCRETKNVECYTTRMVHLYNKYTREGKTVYPRCGDRCAMRMGGTQGDGRAGG